MIAVLFAPVPTKRRMAVSAPLDTTIEVVTPENIAFDYQLAGPFRRLPAYLIDVAIRLVTFLAIIFLVMMSGMLAGGLFGSGLLPALGAAVLLILYFLQAWFYGVFFEAYFNGRTPGKWICGLRVISDDGHPITGMQALIRNLLRAIDLMPATTLAALDPEDSFFAMLPLMTGMVGLVTMLSTRRLQRLGDLAAGTMVVMDERNWTLPVARVDDLRVPALSSFVPADYRATPTMAKALANYAERRLYLSPPRRREIARHLAVPLLDRFEFRRDVDPDLLLYAIYYRTFLADGVAEAPQLGSLSGFSPLAKDAQFQDATAAHTTAAAATQPSATHTAATQPSADHATALSPEDRS
ncbi:RDD family protein [Candidatus Laterigemmans baculatus]|uniref:RDD family protein n=1 Tax=Candidatus Laterigemmans baculatus TaxID=2770505 RepID=UPI001F1D62B5|nr:RDD family protein [Candidatus Laterigemmans baculatus]